MKELEEQLIHVLEEENRLYLEIKAAKEAETKALLDFSAGALEETNHKMEILSLRSLAIEEERRDIVHQIAQLNEKGNEPTLKELLPFLSEEARVRAGRLAEQLKTTCLEISQLQINNTNIIERSVRYLKELVESLVRKAQLQPVAYNMTGTFDAVREATPGLLDRTI